MNLDAWLAALQERHRSTFTSAEFLKALRALSARYVERRSQLAARSPLDSAGKRAAFAAFYAPLHFLTVREILRALRPPPPFARSARGFGEAGGARAIRTIVDLGCGTGVASAAWALEQPSAPHLIGIDTHAWTIAEAKWNWRQLGLKGDARQADLVTEVERLVARPRSPLAESGVVAGWSVNELEAANRERVLAALLALADRGAAVLIVEPLARAVAPWWDDWTRRLSSMGARADEWKFDVALPGRLATIDAAAGFRREGLSARSVWISGD